MSKESFTPGPWVYVDFDNVIVSEAGRILDVQPRSLHVSKEERDANGFLAAAAPDLLASLRELVEAFVATDEEGLIEHAEPMQRARAAIARATSLPLPSTT